MDDFKSYLDDVVAEVRRAPWLVAVVVAGLLFAGSASTRVTSGLRAALQGSMHHSSGRMRLRKTDVRCSFSTDGSWSDSELEML